MKKLILAVLALAVVAFGQQIDTLVAQHQVVKEAEVVRPSVRWVSPAASVGDSIRIDVYTNGVRRVRWQYRMTQAALDTANVTKAIVKAEIVDVSK